LEANGFEILSTTDSKLTAKTPEKFEDGMSPK
jgi:hypothetical protein